MDCAKVLDCTSREKQIRKELQYLYNRRSAVEMLIRSLEHYDQFQARPMAAGDRQKTA